MNIQEAIDEFKEKFTYTSPGKWEWLENPKMFQEWLKSKLQEIYQQGRKDMKNEAIEALPKEKGIRKDNDDFDGTNGAGMHLTDVGFNLCLDDIKSSLTKLITTDYPDICTHGLDRKDCRECS